MTEIANTRQADRGRWQGPDLDIHEGRRILRVTNVDSLRLHRGAPSMDLRLRPAETTYFTIKAYHKLGR